MKHLLIITGIIFLSLALLVQAAQPGPYPPNEELETQAERLLREMIFLFGDTHLKEAPSIHITSTFKFGARYINNRIEIEQQILDICRSLGADSSNALAFVIGHELTHFFQGETDHANAREPYQAFFYGFNSGVRIEREADLQGAFMSYLAGFSPQTVLPSFLTKLYQNYQIDESNMANYPSRDEREKSFDEMLKLLEKAIEIHRSAIYLSILGEHYLATQGYSYLLTFYKGKEIYHNLGLNQLLQALNTGKYIWDPALYPVEIDLNTRLRKPISRAPQILDDHRKRLLTEAIDNLSVAIERSAGDFSSHLNKLCALILLQKYGEARVELSAIQGLQLSKEKTERLRIMEALLYIKEGKQDLENGANLLKRLTKSSDELIKRIAKHNYSVYIKEKISPATTPRTESSTISLLPNKPDLSSLGKKEPISKRVAWSFLKDGQDTYYSFDDGIEEKVLYISESTQNILPKVVISRLDEMNLIFGSNEILFYRIPESGQFYGVRNGQLILTGTLFK